MGWDILLYDDVGFVTIECFCDFSEHKRHVL